MTPSWYVREAEFGHVVKVPWEGNAIYLQMWDWCADNVGSHWHSWRVSADGERWMFENIHDATSFALAWS